MEVTEAAAWCPPGLRLAFMELAGNEAILLHRARLERLVTDPRLERLYRRLDPVLPDSFAWRGYLQVCEDAAWAVQVAPRTRESRQSIPEQLQRIEKLATELAAALEELQGTVLAAAVSTPLELFMLPELVEKTAADNALYKYRARSHVRALLRVPEAAVPTPAQLLATIASVAAETSEAPLEPVPCAALEAALGPRKQEIRWYDLHTCALAFDAQLSVLSSVLEVMKGVHLSNADLAAVGSVVLNWPEKFGDYSAEEIAERATEAVRDARRTRDQVTTKGDHQRGGGGDSAAKNLSNPHFRAVNRIGKRSFEKEMPDELHQDGATGATSGLGASRSR